MLYAEAGAARLTPKTACRRNRAVTSVEVPSHWTRPERALIGCMLRVVALSPGTARRHGARLQRQWR